jgi:membrane-bound ClpP family serine protease
MSTTFILIYIIAIVSIVLAIAGLTSLIYGLAVKNKTVTIRGSIMTFLAVLILVTGIFYGAHKVYNFGLYKYQVYKKHHQADASKFDKMCDTTMMKCCKGGMKDSTMMKCCNKMKKEGCDKDKAAKCCNKDKESPQPQK